MRLFFQPRKRCGVLVAGSAALMLSTLLLVNCGDVYRPVANPVPAPGGDPQAMHLALVVNNNHGGAGSTTQVDVAGDTNIGNFAVGHGPVHATFSVSLLRALVANMADDTLSFYSPTQAGTTVTTISLPQGAAPVFVESTDPNNIYVADSGANAVSVVSAASLVVTNSIPVGVRPVALAETPDVTRLYAVNQGDGSVTAISTASRSVLATIPVGVSPTWAAMKSDGSTLYVANQGSGTVSVIDVPSNTVTATLPVGAGPRFLTYDSHLQRLYVANTGANTISVFNTQRLTDPPVTITVGNNPTAITALADGTRIYVANAGCQDRLDLATPCSGNTVSIIDATSLAVRKTVTVGTGPVWLDSSPDSIRVIVANRDSDNISDIRTSDDTVVGTLPAGSPTPLFVTISH